MRRPSAPRLGFSLVEVLVALLILEVGMLATSALALQALRTHRAAVELERAGWAARLVMDSLAASGSPASGERRIGELRVRWRTTGADAVALEAVLPGRAPILKLRLPLGPGAP